MLPPSEFVDGARLERMPALEPYPIPGMQGQWMCRELSDLELVGYMNALCARFIPKGFSIEDPMIDADTDITLMTYLSSRFDDDGTERPVGSEDK